MSSSAHKDLFHVMFIHKIPPDLSKDEFESKFEPLIDEMVQLPVVQKNLVKLDLIIQNDKADKHTPSFGLSRREDIVLVAVQTETPEHFLAVFGDPEVRKVMGKGKEFELHSSSYACSADVVAKLDRPAPRVGDHLICVYNVPPSLSGPQHDTKFHEWLDTFVCIPAVNKHFVRLEVWQQNKFLDDHIQGFGFSPAGPTFIHHAKLESWDSSFAMLTDPEAHKSALEAMNAGHLGQNGYAFSCDVLTKLDNST